MILKKMLSHSLSHDFVNYFIIPQELIIPYTS